MRDALFVKVDPEHEVHLPPLEKLQFQHGSFGEPRDLRPDPSAPRNIAERVDNTTSPQVMVEVIVFGKIHYVTVAEFKQRSSRYAVMLWTERDLLLDLVGAIGKIEEDWRRGSLVGRFGSLFRDDEALGRRLRALRAVLKSLKDPRDNPHSERLREMGIVLHQVRSSMANLQSNATALRDKAIEGAQTAEQYTGLLKDTAFQALLMVPSLVPVMKNPVTEFAYRISIVMVEASAGAAGAWIAGSPRLREVFGVLKSRLPQVLIDTFMSVVEGYLGPSAKAARPFGLILLQQIVEFCFDVVMMGIDGRFSEATVDDALMDLAEQRLLSIFGVVLGMIIGCGPNDSRARLLAKQVLEQTVTVLAQEARTLLHRAKEEGRSVGEVAMSEAPWLIARVIQGVLLGMLQHAHTEAKPEDETRPRRSAPVRDTARLMALQMRNRKLIFGNPTHAESAAPRARPLRWEEIQRDWSRLNLKRVFLHGVTRLVGRSGMIFEGRIGNPNALRHVDAPGVIFKQGWCKAKTLKRSASDLVGLVVRPFAPAFGAEGSRELHESKELWRKTLREIRATGNGFLVRPDGALFHPEQLVEWSRSQPDRAEIRALVKHLKAAAVAGHVELDHPDAQAFLRDRFGSEEMRDAFMATLARAHVGVTADTDMVGVYDGRSGTQVAVGTEVKLPGQDAFTQDAARLDALNEGGNSFHGPARDQETEVGKRGKAMYAHGGAAEQFLGDGTLAHPSLGAVFGVAQGGDESLRWTVDMKSGEVSVPREYAVRLGLAEEEHVPGGRFPTFGIQTSEATATRLMSVLRALPPGDPGVRSCIDGLGLVHLPPEVRARFAETLHALARAGDDGSAASLKTHVDDALTLSMLKRIRDIHIETHRPYYQRLHKLAVLVPKDSRKEESIQGNLTALKYDQRRRVPAEQVTDAPIEQVGAINTRSVEAGLVARGLTLLDPENAGAFDGVVAVAAIPEIAAWCAARHIAIGVDATRKELVVACRGSRTAFEGLLKLYELAERFGLDGTSLRVWWELYLPVLPSTTSHVAGRLDPPSFTPRLPGPVSEMLSFGTPREGWELHAMRALRALTSFPDGAAIRRSFAGLKLEAVWRHALSGRIETAGVTLAGRPIAVFLSAVIEVPDEFERVTRPLRADLADLHSVRGYQIALYDLGYLEKRPDGVIDAETRQAVAAFQVDAEPRLHVDGVMGPATREALREALRARELDEVAR